MSFMLQQELQIPYTMGLPVHNDPYHLPILRNKVCVLDIRVNLYILIPEYLY